MFLDLRQASEQYFTSCQFLAHDLRQVLQGWSADNIQRAQDLARALALVPRG